MNETEARLRRQQAIIYLVTTAASLAVTVWMLVPEHQRRLWLMTLTHRSVKVISGSAKRAGHAAMGRELATGLRDYTVPFLLSRLRDRAATWYERLREVP